MRLLRGPRSVASGHAGGHRLRRPALPLRPVSEVAEEQVVSCVVSIRTGYHRETEGLPEGFLDK